MRVVVTSHSSTAIVPQFYFRTTDVTGSINLPSGVEMVMPGDDIEMEVELITHRHREATSVRYPRRWSYRGCWRRLRNH